jgi:hypothetical protein
MESRIVKDEDGTGYTDIMVTFNATYVMNYVDGTKSDRVALLSDGIDLIYVRVDMKDIGNYSVNRTYKITGLLSYYYHHLEISIDSVWEDSDNISFDITSISSEYDITQLNMIAASLHTRDKGAIFTEVVSFTARYIAKTDNKKAMFFDGEQVISIHGDAYINNNLSLGSTYTIYGIVGKYTGILSVEYHSQEFVQNGDIDDISFESSTDVKLSSIYGNRPDSWESEYFPFILKASVYIDTTNGEDFVIKDSQGSRIKWQSDTLFAQALIIQNASNLIYSQVPLLDYYDNEEEVTVYFTIYQYLSGSHMWSVHILDIVE